MRVWELSKIFVGDWKSAENIGPTFVFKSAVAEIKKALSVKKYLTQNWEESNNFWGDLLHLSDIMWVSMIIWYDQVARALKNIRFFA